MSRSTRYRPTAMYLYQRIEHDGGGYQQCTPEFLSERLPTTGQRGAVSYGGDALQVPNPATVLVRKWQG